MKVNEPIQIAGLSVRNRLAIPPMRTGLSSPEDLVTDEMLEYYRSRTADGFMGMAVIEHAYVSRQGKAAQKQLSIASDYTIEGLARLAAAVHASGTAAILQISHAGSKTISTVTGMETVSASVVMNPSVKALERQLPRELGQSEISCIVDEFSAAALRAKEAGFDGVELHCAHGYLLNQFYSPLTNLRIDRYGTGTVQSRILFTLEICRQIRNRVGRGFLISVRFGGCDYIDGGSTLSDAVAAAKFLSEAGADLLSISGGMCRFIRPNHSEPGYFSDISSAIKVHVTTPVLLTGGVTAIKEAETLLCEGRADLIGIGRAVMKEPGWAARQFAK